MRKALASRLVEPHLVVAAQRRGGEREAGGLAPAQPGLGEPAELGGRLVVLAVGGRQQPVQRRVALRRGGVEVDLVLGGDGHPHPEPGHDRGEVVPALAGARTGAGRGGRAPGP